MDFKISVSAGARASDEIQFICDCKHNMRNRENACAFVFYSFKVYKSKLDFNKCSSVLCLHPYVDSTELSAKAFLLLHLYCGRDFFREPHASGEWMSHFHLLGKTFYAIFVALYLLVSLYLDGSGLILSFLCDYNKYMPVSSNRWTLDYTSDTITVRAWFPILTETAVEWWMCLNMKFTLQQPYTNNLCHCRYRSKYFLVQFIVTLIYATWIQSKIICQNLWLSGLETESTCLLQR